MKIYDLYENADDGTFSYEVHGAGRATGTGLNKTDAIRSATDLLKRAGGGTIIIHYANGKTEAKDIKC